MSINNQNNDPISIKAVDPERERGSCQSGRADSGGASLNDDDFERAAEVGEVRGRDAHAQEIPRIGYIHSRRSGMESNNYSVLLSRL